MMFGAKRASSRSFRPKGRRPWGDKFGDAFRGLKLGVRGHSSFFVHFFFAALVAAAALVFRCDLLEWCVLLGCIGLRVGEGHKMDWDGPNMTSPNTSEAPKFVKRQNRPGWEA